MPALGELIWANSRDSSEVDTGVTLLVAMCPSKLNCMGTGPQSHQQLCVVSSNLHFGAVDLTAHRQDRPASLGLPTL